MLLTSDFGSDGRTVGMGPEEVRGLVWDVVNATYDGLPHIRQANIVPFLSLGPRSFQDALRHRLRTLGCAYRRREGWGEALGTAVLGSSQRVPIHVSRVDYDEEVVVSFLYQQLMRGLPRRNGREVDKVMDVNVHGPFIRAVSQLLGEQRQREAAGGPGLGVEDSTGSFWTTTWRYVKRLSKPSSTALRVSLDVIPSPQNSTEDGKVYESKPYCIIRYVPGGEQTLRVTVAMEEHEGQRNSGEKGNMEL